MAWTNMIDERAKDRGMVSAMDDVQLAAEMKSRRLAWEEAGRQLVWLRCLLDNAQEEREGRYIKGMRSDPELIFRR